VEGQFCTLVFKMSIACCAVAGQGDAFAEGDDETFFMQLTGGKVQNVDKNVAGVTQVGDGGGERMARGKDGIIVPALDSESLPGAPRIEGGIF
jgi:hypothetical protein